MNVKRIAALGLLGALLTAPAMAANPTSTITVKWNTQQLASLTVVTNYSAAGAQGLGAPAIFTNNNAGTTGACTAAGAGSEVASTANFGNVTPDSVKFTDCNYTNGALAQYSTNDANGYNLTVQETTPATHDANKLLCYLPNGSQTSATVVQSTRTSNALTPSIVAVTQTDATCSAAVAGAVAFKSATTSTIVGAVAATAGTQNAGGDIMLVLQPSAPSGADSTVVTYTLALL
jgi:hypothetical protein